MRARRGMTVGWVVVAAYALVLAGVSVDAVRDPDLERPAAGEPTGAATRFVTAWERSREATFVTTGTYERRSEVTGASIASEDVVAQAPPRRLHRQVGGVDGRDDDRVLVCPAPPEGQEDEREPCRFGPPGGPTYEEDVAQEVEGLRSILLGDDPLYRVTEPQAGCFELELQRVDPRAPFGVAASFCFDEATGAPSSRRVEHEGGIVEVLAVTTIRTDVTETDLTP